MAPEPAEPGACLVPWLAGEAGGKGGQVGREGGGPAGGGWGSGEGSEHGVMRFPCLGDEEEWGSDGGEGRWSW